MKFISLKILSYFLKLMQHNVLKDSISMKEPGKNIILNSIFRLYIIAGVLCLSCSNVISGAYEKKGGSCSYQEVKIESIWQHPKTFRSQKIVVHGTYLGWKGKVDHPQITRSDWAIQDDTGTIYVTGRPVKGLDPYRDIGCRLKLLGTVRVNPKGVLYILAERVIVNGIK